MKTNIKINRVKRTQSEIDAIIEDPKTLNLTGVKSTGQREQARKERKIKNFTRKYLRLFFIILTALMIAIMVMPNNETNASNLSIQDQIRVERLQACSDALKQSDIIPTPSEYIELVKSCAMRMTGVYIVESGYGKHEIRPNNFLGLKRTVNGMYGFHSFASGYDCRYYFATKYFKFHYKKTARTFIYGFWIDNQWKFGRSTTDKETYTNTLYKIENNKELERSYEYLLITQ